MAYPKDQLVAGISIDSDRSAQEPGTLGCFAVLKDDPSTKVLLTAQHVIFDGNPSVPVAISHPSAGISPCCCPKNIIANTDVQGVRKNYPFKKTGVQEKTYYYIDCAYAGLKTSEGVKGINIIPGLEQHSKLESPSGLIKGWEWAKKNMRVGKMGIKSGFETGRIMEVNQFIKGLMLPNGDLIKNLEKQILVQPDNPKVFDPISGSGDSGGALINLQTNKVVGLFHAISPRYNIDLNEDNSLWIACHIAPVLDSLKLDIFLEDLTSPTAGKTLLLPRSTENAALQKEKSLIDSLRTELLKSKLGKQLFDCFQRHWKEVIELVYHCRPVTVIWHRSQGPAFIGHLVKNLKNDEHMIPAEIASIRQADLITKMQAILLQNASPLLREDLNRYRHQILQIFHQPFISIEAILEQVHRLSEETQSSK